MKYTQSQFELANNAHMYTKMLRMVLASADDELLTASLLTCERTLANVLEYLRTNAKES